MTASSIQIVPFVDGLHRAAVGALWTTTFAYDAPHNAPDLVIDRKLAVADGLFFVAVATDVVVGTVMAGYDGHRGWIYSLAIARDHRGLGIGSALLARAEQALCERGCVKINLQIVAGNESVRDFYRANGYAEEPRVSMGKRIADNIPPS